MENAVNRPVSQLTVTLWDSRAMKKSASIRKEGKTSGTYRCDPNVRPIRNTRGPLP